MEDIAIRTGMSIDDVNPSAAKAAVIHGSELREMTEKQLAKVYT